MAPPLAIAFDLNGTISQDEEIYFELFAELFAREGRPVSREEYFERLCGHVDTDVVRLWLGEGFPRVDDLLAERAQRFLDLARGGATVPEHARQAVRRAAGAVPAAVVSGAFRVEVDAILEGAGLTGHLQAVVALEDVEHPKPHPEAYLLASRLLGVDPSRMVAFEDSAVGIASAKEAGLRCIAVLGSMEPAMLDAADEIVERLDEAAVERSLRG